MAQADGNGESGTVSANNYVKGDSAVVCALPLESEQEIAAQVSVSFQPPIQPDVGVMRASVLWYGSGLTHARMCRTSSFSNRS